MANQSRAWSISPSQKFEGSDGPWSTFAIILGSPLELVHILPATSQSSIWTVLPNGYGNANYPNVPQDYSALRGYTFNPDNSDTFTYVDAEGVFRSLPFDSEVDISNNASKYSGGAVVGSDAVLLGTNGDDAPQLKHQTIACFATQNPFLGQLGLKAQNSTPDTFFDGYFSALGYLNSTGAVASSTYGYTAGSNNRSYFGSLTFGGYDAARCVLANGIGMQMSEPSTRDLQLVVSGLKIGSSRVSSFPSTATYFIDSMVPDIWLPGDVCDELEAAYGLLYDTNYQMYFLNNSQHENLTNLDAATTSLTFTLQALGDPSSTTQIEIPYVDLDKQVRYPEAGIQDDSTSYFYFPIRRANSSSQYYLGRTFLQDAYLGVDYDRGIFNVSPAAFPLPNSARNIIEIVNHQPPCSNCQKAGLSGGAIAGISIGAIAGVALIAGLIFFYLRKRKRDRLRFSGIDTMRPMSFDGTTINDQDVKPPIEPEQPTVDYFAKPPMEMDGEEQDKFRTELEGSFTPHERHELYGSSVRRRSDQSRASVSPLPRGESMRGRMGHLRQYSDSSFGQPSPASATGSPPLGAASPPLMGYPSPPLEMDGSFAGPFELHGGPRQGESEVTSHPAPTSVPETTLASAPATVPATTSDHTPATAQEPMSSHTPATVGETTLSSTPAAVEETGPRGETRSD